jgi:hypothetical protein
MDHSSEWKVIVQVEVVNRLESLIFVVRCCAVVLLCVENESKQSRVIHNSNGAQYLSIQYLLRPS